MSSSSQIKLMSRDNQQKNYIDIYYSFEQIHQIAIQSSGCQDSRSFYSSISSRFLIAPALKRFMIKSVEFADEVPVRLISYLKIKSSTSPWRLLLRGSFRSLSYIDRCFNSIFQSLLSISYCKWIEVRENHQQLTHFSSIKSFIHQIPLFQSP